VPADIDPLRHARSDNLARTAHSSSASALPTFDLTVPGVGEYSMMNVFARWNYDKWALDFSGYGHSKTPSGNSDIAMGAEDLRAVGDLIKRESGPAHRHAKPDGRSGTRQAILMQARSAVERVSRAHQKKSATLTGHRYLKFIPSTLTV
jgi:hypothetical protein